MINVNHCSDDDNFKSPLQAKVNDKLKTVNAHFSDKDDEASNGTIDPATTVPEEDEEVLTVENVVSEGNHDANNDILDPSNSDSSESYGSLAQNHSSNQSTHVRSGRRIMKPKKYLATAMFGFLSMQSSVKINQNYNKPMSFFHGQMAHHETINSIDNEMNAMHPFSHVTSKASNDALYLHQAMKADDADDFRKATRKEIKSFKDKSTFELVLLQNKPQC